MPAQSNVKLLSDLFSHYSLHYHRSVPIKHERSVFQWPWQRGGLIEPHGAGSAARTTGCALAPPSRVEEFKEVIVLCGMGSGMQDVCPPPFLILFFLGLSHITCWRRQALKIMWPCLMHVWHCAGTRMFAVTHLHILLWQPGSLADGNKNLSQQLFSRPMHMFGHVSEVDGRLVTWKIDDKHAPYNLGGGHLSAKTAINSGSYQNLMDAEVQIK